VAQFAPFLLGVLHQDGNGARVTKLTCTPEFGPP
jgi:hypothetical protein